VAQLTPFLLAHFATFSVARFTPFYTLNFGEFNKLSIPILLSVGTDVELFGKSFSAGLKGYYGLNQVVNDVPRKNHYFRLGLILAMNL
jgi:hypothetical protein